MKKKMILLLVSIAIGNGVKSQIVSNPTITQINTGGQNSVSPVHAHRTRTFQYYEQTNGNYVNAVINCGDNSTASFWYERVWRGLTYQGRVPILVGVNRSILNPDIIVGGFDGNRIMVVYQAHNPLEIGWISYKWTFTTYVEEDRGTVSHGMPGYIYGNPRIDYHESTGDVVVTYNSYGNSPTIEGYARYGDIFGNWGSVHNISSMLLNPSVDNMVGPLSVSIQQIDSHPTYTPGTYVHYAFVAETGIGREELWHLMYLVDMSVSPETHSMLQFHELYGQSTSNVNMRQPSIDTWPGTDANGIENLWTVAVQAEQLSEGSIWFINSYSGSSGPGGFTSHNLTSSSGWYNCENRNADVAYSQEEIKVVWEHVDCNPLSIRLDVRDVIGHTLSIDGTPNMSGHSRVNNTMPGDQRAASIGGSIMPLSGPAIGWLDVTADDFFFKHTGVNNFSVAKPKDQNFDANSQEGAQLVLGSEEQLLNTRLSVYPNPTSGMINVEGLKQGEKLQVFDTFGRLIVERKHDYPNLVLDLSNLSKGIYVIKTGEGAIKQVVLK